MKNKIFLFSLLAIVIAAAGSCKKGDTGGDATIDAIPMHHSTRIKGATLYIKFDAKELPANPTSDYDMKLVGANDEDHILAEGLRYGHYYLYCEGFDSTIMAPVKGGVAVKIKWGQRKDEIDVTVPVTED